MSTASTDPADFSPGDMTTGVFARLSDWANPILVKEVRQALKSRQFVTTFMLLLVAAWVVAVFGMALSGDSLEYGAVGRGFFYAFYVVLSVATVLVVPFGAHRSLLSERDLNTFELLSITTLKPRQIVWGKLLSALVQLFIFYSAITPFMAFSSLLQGFDAPSAGYILLLSLLGSLMLSMAALMLSTLVRQRVGQVFMMLVVLGGLGMALMFVLTMVNGVVHFTQIAFDDPDFWWANLFVLLTAVTYFVLLQQITTAQLTFDADNRSTGIRVAAAAQFWLLWGALIGMLLYEPANYATEMLFVFPVMSAIHWAVFGLFFSTEENELSHRVLRDLPRSTLLRLLLIPLMPGGARGFLFLLLNTAGLWLLVAGCFAIFDAPASSAAPTTAVDWLAGIVTFHHESWNTTLQFTTALCCYLIIYVGFGTVLGRWGRALSNDIHAGHVRLLTFLALMAGMIFPYVPKALRLVDWQGYTLIDLTNPIATLMEIEDGGTWGDSVMVILLIAALLMVLVNLRAMQRGVAEILLAERRPRLPDNPVHG